MNISDNQQSGASTHQMMEHPKTKQTIIQLLSNLANPQEIEQYFKRFVNAGQTQFAVIKIGGSIIENDLDNLCSSLSFLVQIGLFPIIVHGAGPQLNTNLEQAGIDCNFIEGQRVTTPAILQIAKNTFIQQNLKLANQLQSLGVKTSSITTGVFTAKQTENSDLGFVGEVTHINTQPIAQAISNGAIPILSSLAETETGQTLNINADVATNQLAIAIKPYKIIFLTGTGGLLDENGKIISSINLITEYSNLIEQPWLQGGMKLKIKQVAEILSQLPSTASVSITKPENLAKELFTHKGSGTLIRKGESIMSHDNLETVKKGKLKSLIESSFQRTLVDTYFEEISLKTALITYCYRAAAIITNEEGYPFLDKFAVDETAKGEGLGKAIWEKLISQTPEFFWRSRIENPINSFYYKKSDGCQKSGEWIVFWVGFNDMQLIQKLIAIALSKPKTLK